MRKTCVAITALALVPLGAAGCVSKSEYTKTVQAAEARYNALEAENTRLKSELANAGKRNEQLTADRAELERTLTMKSGELGKSVADLRQRVSALEGDHAPLTQRYPTNWELSAARAINVSRYLQKQGIESGNLSATAFGEFKPVADNATLEGRAKNRRIEIVLVPKE